MNPKPPILAVLLVALVGCATGPRYDATQVDASLTASQVAAAPAEHQGAHVIWGGIIVTTRNLPGYTEMEVLSYPLDSSQRPLISGAEQGRFLARTSRYLEAIDYAPGRRVTLRGTVEQTLEGKVGEAAYTFPLIQADDVYLWSRDGGAPTTPQFHFGIGVIFGR